VIGCRQLIVDDDTKCCLWCCSLVRWLAAMVCVPIFRNNHVSWILVLFVTNFLSGLEMRTRGPIFAGSPYVQTLLPFHPRTTKLGQLTHVVEGHDSGEGQPCLHPKGAGPIVPNNFGTASYARIIW